MTKSLNDLLDTMFGDYSYQLTRMFPNKTDDELLELITKVDKDVLMKIWNSHIDRFTDGELQYIQSLKQSIILEAYNKSLSCVLEDSAKYFKFLDSTGQDEVKN